MVLMASIKPLSEEVLSTVRSGFIISSLATVVEELVYNSLDASARKVSVLVGVNNGYIKVEDDGSGINRDGLMLLGERYATSKGRHLNVEDDSVGTFGFRGEVLCSIADISLLEIVTKIQGRPNGYRKVMKGRKCLYLSIDDKQDVGTSVVVRDLFYNQPVRRRQLQSSIKKVLHSIRECVIRIAVVQPNAAFRVVDMESEDELLCTHASPSPLSLLCSNFGIESSSLCKLGFSEGLLKLTGYVSAPSSLLSSKAIQYIYINSRFVVKGPIHKALTCLADMCWDRFRVDKGGKRTQFLAGPSYCLNLACPRTSYDLNIEVSGTSVEFKDWAPVIKFIENSVALFWSKKQRKGELSDEIQTHGMEYVAKDLSLSRKDWRLKTCENTTKRRKTENTENDKGTFEDPLYCMEMQAEDRSSSSLKISQTKAFHFQEPETEREYSVCENSTDDNIRESLLLDKNHVESDVGIIKRDGNCAESHLSLTRWKDEIRGDDLGGGSTEVESGFNSEYKHDIGRNEGCMNRKLMLGSPPWDPRLETPLSVGSLSGFQFEDFESTSWRSIGRGDSDGLDADPDVFQMTCQQRDVPNTWLLPKLATESHVLNDLNSHSLPSCIGVSDKQPKYLIENVCEYPSSCFARNSAQHSEIPYPLLIKNDCYLDHISMDDGAQRIFELRNCFGFDVSDDEKEEFCHNAIDYRCINENLSSPSSFDTKLFLGSGCTRVSKGKLELSFDGFSSDDISSITYGDLLARETNSPSSDLRPRDSSFSWSPSVPIKMNLQRCQTRGCDDILRKRSRASHNRCPDSPLFGSSDDILIAETFSPRLNFRSKSNTYVTSGHRVSSTPVGPDVRRDLLGCRPTETNHSPSKLFEKSSVRARRSHSAPPIYPGKRRFLSVGDCLTPTTDTVLLTNPQVHSMSERAVLEHSIDSPRLCREYHQDDEMSCADDPHFCIDRQVKGDPIISQDNMWSQDVKASDSGYVDGLQDLESSRIKWREGCLDTALKRITNSQSVGDSLNESKDGNRVLDLQSCMLYLAGDSLVPKSINRNCLESATVLMQVDSKFIPVVGRGILAVIDQHAADERIQLEEMRQKILCGELMSITYLEEEKELVLPEMGYQLLCNYVESIQHWGWICNIFCQDSGSFSKNLNLLNDQAPHLRLLAVPCILGVKLSDTDLLEYLEQLADTDGSSSIPPSVVRVLNYKACRGAIMFGDKLLQSECSLIVEELKHTSLCFQCAHGRPTTVPLVNLKALHKGVSQLGSSREGSKTTWHGLRRDNISLERAKHRLDAARGC